MRVKKLKRIRIKSIDNKYIIEHNGILENNMRILTEDNKCFLMNTLPVEPVDIRYGILDYSNQTNVDFFWMPLIFLESFSAPAADLKIGPYRVQIPLDWSIVVGDKNSGDLEVISISHLNDRDFEMFCFNPISGFRPEFHKVEIVNVYPDLKWYFPKLKFGHLLVVPLLEHAIVNQTTRPDGKVIEQVINPCIYTVRETNKIPESLDLTKIFG